MRHSSERHKVARTYRLYEETVFALDTLAAMHGVYQSNLLDYLLRSALRQVGDGRLVIRTRTVRVDLDDTVSGE
jgi:hypothetical protein